MPPQAVQVEQSVLGAMMLERDAIPKTIEILQRGSFYTERHNLIYDAILSLFERSNPVDMITLGDELKRRGNLDQVGGAYYLTELTSTVATAANVEYHARILAEKSLLRKLIETMTTMVGRAYDPTADAFDFLRLEGQVVFKRNPTGYGPRWHQSIRGVALDVSRPLHRMIERHEREGGHVSRMVAPLAVLLKEGLDVAMKLDAAVFDDRSRGELQRTADRGGLLDGHVLAGHDGGDRIGEILGVGLGLPHEPARVQVVDKPRVSQHPVAIDHEHLRCGRRPKVGRGSFVGIEKHPAGDLRLGGDPIDLDGIRCVADHRDERHALRPEAFSKRIERRQGVV